MARAGIEQRRDLGTLYIAQALGEGKSGNKIVAELRQRGYSYGSRSQILDDIRAIKGAEKRPSPGAIKGGKVSGFMRSKAARNLPAEKRPSVRQAASAFLDRSVKDGPLTGKPVRLDYNPITKQFSIIRPSDYGAALAVGPGEEVPQDEALATGLGRKDALDLFDSFESLYRSLGI